jgi:hypothetical protein
MYVSAETHRNLSKRPKHLETPQNFTRGGIGGCLVPVCILVRDFQSVPVGTERIYNYALNPRAPINLVQNTTQSNGT